LSADCVFAEIQELDFLLINTLFYSAPITFDTKLVCWDSEFTRIVKGYIMPVSLSARKCFLSS